jgi:hypothetical protein
VAWHHLQNQRPLRPSCFLSYISLVIVILQFTSWLRALRGSLRVIPYFLWIVFRSRPRRTKSARLSYQLQFIREKMDWSCGTRGTFFFLVTRLCRCEASRRSRDDRCEMCDDAVLAVKLLATLEVLRSELDFFVGRFRASRPR